LIRIQDIKIRQKLPSLIVGLAILASVATGAVACLEVNKMLNRKSSELLSAAAQSRAKAVNSFFAEIEAQVKEFGQSPEVAASLDRFTAAYNDLGPSAEANLQRAYIDDNPNPLGSKEILNAATTNGAYDAVHAQLHPWFRSILRMNGYYDIFLFDATGRNVYTVFKERDFGTQLASGQWRATNLGELVRQVLAGPADAAPKFADFKPYAPSNDVPAGFVAVPIKGADGRVKGVFAIQLSIEKLDASMAPMPANGNSGENTLVGPDGLARNNSRFESQATILKRRVQNQAVDAAREGKIGVVKGATAKGEKAWVAYAPTQAMGTNFAVIADITSAEVSKPLSKLFLNITILMLVVSVVATGIGMWFARTITKPISALTQAMLSLAQGDTETEIEGQQRRDELGDCPPTTRNVRAGAG
jgi:methyl-accepting chemotaxis protein